VGAGLSKSNRADPAPAKLSSTSTFIDTLQLKPRAQSTTTASAKMGQDLPPTGGYEPVQYKVYNYFFPLR